MDVLPMQSLKRMALSKIAVALWMTDDTLKETNYLGEGDLRSYSWWRVETLAIQKVYAVGLREGLDRDLEDVVKPIGIEILRWMTFHATRYLGIGFPSLAIWKCQGVVDKMATAKAVLEDENFDIVKRFKLACLYCLEDSMRALWNRLQPDEKRPLFRESSRSKYSSRLVLLWIHKISGGDSDICSKATKYLADRSFNKGAFDLALRGGNDIAVAYFLKGLTEREKRSLVRYSESTFINIGTTLGIYTDAPVDYNPDVARVLVSSMTEDQQIELFANGPCSLLLCYLDWPWQSRLLEVAETLWVFFSPEDFYNLLTQVTHRIVDGYNDHDYQSIWLAAWQRAEDPHRSYIVDRSHEQLLLDLLNRRLWEPIRLLLGSATEKQKDSILFNSRVRGSFKYLIYRNELQFLLQFIRHCIMTQETIQRFQNSFRHKYLECSSKRLLEAKDQQWKEFLIRLDLLAIEYGVMRPV